VDVVLILILFVYITQTIDIIARKIADKENRPFWLVIFPGIFILSLLFGFPRFAVFVLLFFLTFWSSACRSSGYGFNYHFILVVVTGIVFGPTAGIIMGVLPLLIAPLIRPDAQIIALYASAFLLAIVGFVSGFFGGLPPSSIISFTATSLIVYLTIRAFILFGKTSVKDVYIFTVVNLGLNYYLITHFLIPLAEYLTI